MVWCPEILFAKYMNILSFFKKNWQLCLYRFFHFFSIKFIVIMLNKIKISVASLLICLPFLAQAHEGHGAFTGGSLSHYLASPLHIIPVVAFVVIGAYFLYKRATTR